MVTEMVMFVWWKKGWWEVEEAVVFPLLRGCLVSYGGLPVDGMYMQGSR